MKSHFGTRFRIAVLAGIMAVMLSGLFCPYSCDALYEKISDMNSSVPEVNGLSSRGIHDCTVESLNVTSQILGWLERRDSLQWFNKVSIAPEDFPGSASIDRMRFFILIFFLAGLSCCSVLHICYIHLKDGNK